MVQGWFSGTSRGALGHGAVLHNYLAARRDIEDGYRVRTKCLTVVEHLDRDGPRQEILADHFARRRADQSAVGGDHGDGEGNLGHVRSGSACDAGP